MLAWLWSQEQLAGDRLCDACKACEGSERVVVGFGRTARLSRRQGPRERSRQVRLEETR